MIEKQDCKRLFFIILSVLLLFAGGMIYLNFRPHTLQMFSWLKFIGAETLFHQKEFNNDSVFLSFVIFQFPMDYGLYQLLFYSVKFGEGQKNHFYFIRFFFLLRMFYLK